MKVSTKKAHPHGRSRAKNATYRVWGVGASAHGNGRLPEDTDHVTIYGSLDDGVDLNTSTTISVTFDLASNPNDLDTLIGKLTDLRAHQQRLRALAK